jgi:hypothetical protein
MKPRRTARIYSNSVLLTSMALMLFIIAGNLAGGNVPIAVNGVDILGIPVLLVYRYWLRQGRIRLVGGAPLAIAFAGLTVSVALLGTVRVLATSIYMLLVIVAGLVFDLGGLIAMTVLCSLAIAGLIVAGNSGWLPRPDYANTISQWVMYTVTFMWVGSLTLKDNQTRAARDSLNKNSKPWLFRSRTRGCPGEQMK